jgi:glycosyltransferase involved in cell wall biosynthesis
MKRPDFPKLSVVIPVYNNADTVSEAIASVRSQAGPCRDIIVVDDGSSDATPQVLDDLIGPDLTVIRQQNAGPAAARNMGIALARGEWIAFHDADDLWLPAKLEAQFAALRRSPDARFCFTGMIMRLPDGTEFTRECSMPRRSLFIDLLKGNRLGTPTALIRRDCFTEVGLFDSVLRTGEDWDMWLRLAAFFEGVLICKPLVLMQRSADPNKYSVELLERCQNRMLHRLFSNPRIVELYPELPGLRRRVYAWHHSVLAKSYFRQKRLYRSGCRAFAAIRSHPSAVRCLLPSAGAPW